MHSSLWVVDVFFSFVSWTHGAFTTRPRSAAYEPGADLLLYVTAVLSCWWVVGRGGGDVVDRVFS